MIPLSLLFDYDGNDVEEKSNLSVSRWVRFGNEIGLDRGLESAPVSFSFPMANFSNHESHNKNKRTVACRSGSAEHALLCIILLLLSSFPEHGRDPLCLLCCPRPTFCSPERDDFCLHQEQSRGSHVAHRCFHTLINIRLKKKRNLRAHGSLAAVFPGESSRVDVRASFNQEENHGQV